MTPCPFIEPIAPLPEELQTSCQPPSNHVQSSVLVIFPPGPQGPAFISPSPCHLPANASSFFVSAPGLGGACGCCAIATAVPSPRESATIRSRVLMKPPLCSGFYAPVEPPGGPFDERRTRGCALCSSYE